MSHVTSTIPPPYARELERLTDGTAASPAHLAHAEALARAFSEVHASRLTNGEDAYAEATRGVFEGQRGLFRALDGLFRRGRLSVSEGTSLETCAVAWRWRLLGRAGRLCPLANADPDTLPYPSVTAMTGVARGEAAHDLARVAVCYLAHGADDAEAWERSFRPLWNVFFRAYFAASGDAELLDVAPLFFATEALAQASSARFRRNAEASLVRFAVATLAAKAFDPDAVERFVER